MGKKESRSSRGHRGLDSETKGTAVAEANADNGDDTPSARIPIGDHGAKRRVGGPDDFERRRKTSSIEEEKGDVFKIIVDLEAQLESTFAMKEALENDLEASRKEVGDLRWSNKDLEARVTVLDEEVAAATDLQSELSFAEEEKARALEKSQDLEEGLNTATEERDSLNKAIAETRSNLQEAEKARGDLEAQVYRLNEKVRGLEEIQADLVQIRSERDRSVDRVRELDTEVESVKTANRALDLALKHSEQAAKDLLEDKKQLDRSVTDLLDEKRATRARMERLEEENEASIARISVLDSEVGDLTSRGHSLEAEMDAARRTLGEIHTALADTKAKARKRYYRVKKG